MRDHTVSHDHGGGGHSHAPANYSKAFAIGIGLNLAFVLIEALYGVRAGSLALLADAGHNLSDVFGLVLAWVGAILSRRAPTPNRTYGMRRASVLAALANAILLLVAIAAIAWEAVGRLSHPAPVASRVVMLVAGIGIVVNAATALLFMSGRKGDLNVRGAFTHMAADAIVSAGVVIAGFAMSVTGILWLDPAMSLLIVLVIAAGTWGLLRDSVNLAMDAVPAGINCAEVEAHLRQVNGVTEVHDLHIWGMSTTEAALTVHLVRPAVEDDDAVLTQLYKDLHDKFNIEHPTVQIERGHGPHGCRLAASHVV
ncbi:MAG: cation diffusion facilitator family transporter [Gemmatimonadaceae bacterium]